MPGFGDTTFIVLLALLLFGPKKLPVLARQLGKLMGDFRRASNEFRTQMEEELRISEQADRQKQIAALEASAPSMPAPEVHPEAHTPPAPPSFAASDYSGETQAESTSVPENTIAPPQAAAVAEAAEPAAPAMDLTPAPLPIATS